MAAFDRLLDPDRASWKLDLSRIRALVAALDHPERACPTVLIAGTNGKGSVAAMVERALRAAGLRTGRYTSPHLVRPEERIAIDGVPVDGAAFDRAIEDVLAVEATCLADGRLAERVTFFEAMTAVAYEVLRRARVDVAVIEVGLGGRLDATNVCDPVATAIVSVDLDHQGWLGDTRAAIATEKAAIARPGVPLVVGDLTDEALDAVVCATGRIDGIETSVAAMEYSFIGGSMGVVVGEKITRAIERAIPARQPVVIVSCSGGARMMEGILSLMQMAKVSAALARLSQARLPYISVLTDPTTGGVTASYAMLGDVNVAEPKALIGFAGPRVIEQTIRQTLPEGFQRSEFLLAHGMLDLVVDRREMKATIGRLLHLFIDDAAPTRAVPEAAPAASVV